MLLQFLVSLRVSYLASRCQRLMYALRESNGHRKMVIHITDDSQIC
jgi:hypothetical protein